MTTEPVSAARPPDSRLVVRTQNHLFAFIRELHSCGLSVPTNKQLDFFAGIEQLGPSTTGQLYWVGAATLVTSETGQAIFDDVFHRFFGATADALVVNDELSDELDEPDDDDDEETRTSGDQDVDEVVFDDAGGSGLLASRVSLETPRTFAPTDDGARDLMRQICDALPGVVPKTRSRRRRPGSRRHRVDLRAIYLESRRTHGEIVPLRWRHRPHRERRVLILVDVSGSMKQYSPDYLRFAHTVIGTCDRAEAFTFGTRLTRVTAALRNRDVDVALSSLAQVVLDADGGTQIGASLQEFLSNAHFVTLARGALVIVLSDGLERGDCDAMAVSVRRLAQLAHQLAWWSPLACDPNYQPLTRGMSAVLGDLDAITGVQDLRTSLVGVRDGFPRDSRSPNRRDARV
jgi:uncharacterized protein with von Willebrand factor type A (vWA) domain